LNKLNAILVVIESFEPVQQVLAKAMVLARHFGAGLELFLCDSEQAYMLKHAYDQAGVDQARQACLANAHKYLESLRLSVLADDVPISLDVACKSPRYESVVHKVLASRPDLVIKSVETRTDGSASLDANDWQLARACPVPLMFTHGRPWRAQPRFAAAVDVSPEESDGMAHCVMRAAQFLAHGCHAMLDAVFSERVDGGAPGASGERALQALGTEFGLSADHLRLLHGDAETALCRFADEQRYDVFVIGALTHRSALTVPVGTLTSKLVNVLDCDALLVRDTMLLRPA
jgi:nucleotide-binding universal stress UspA family protein